MRMRSPSSAPPLRRRVGSIATTAICACGKCRTRRASSSSVRLDLPAPPVPVTPTTGTLWRARASMRRTCSSWPSAPAAPSSTEMVRAICPWSRGFSGRSS